MLGFAIPVGILCALFAIFTLVMFCDQIKMIIEDTSTIDKKMVQQQIERAKLGKRLVKLHEEKPIIEALKSVFGPNVCTWAIPMNIGLDLSVENQLTNSF